ncbi:MAG: ABC transporter substrate-binding protein [Phycisphaerales bacterium JB058]
MRLAITLILTGLLAVLPSCSNDTKEPGTSETRDNQPRIVSLSPAGSKILIDLGLEETIVGRHNFDRAASADVPPVGEQGAIDYEKLLSIGPTHVIVQTDSQSMPARLTQIAGEAGFEIMNLTRTLTLDDVQRATRQLEDRFASGAGLAEQLAHAIKPRDEGRPGWGTVLIAMQTAPTVDILGPGSAHHELIERLGYTPAITDGKPYMPTDAEDVLAMDPGVIVLVMPRAPDEQAAPSDWRPSPEELGSLAGLGMRAVDSGRVVLIDDPLALLPSTAFIGVSDQLERRLGALGPLGSQHDDRGTDTTEAGPN